MCVWQQFSVRPISQLSDLGKNKMIKAICFDLDGVFFTEKSFKTFKAEIAELSKYPHLVDDVFHGSKMVDFKLNRISENEFWDYSREILGTTITNEKYFETLRDSYSIDQKIFDFIKQIKKNGYQACICSNNFVTRIRELDHKFDFLKYFDIKIFSFDIGILKPRIEIFQALVVQSEMHPSEIAYSDDDKSKLEGAKQIGINTFVFKNFEQFKHELELRSVCIH